MLVEHLCHGRKIQGQQEIVQEIDVEGVAPSIFKQKPAT